MTELVRKILALALLCAVIAVAAHVAPQHWKMSVQATRGLLLLQYGASWVAVVAGLFVMVDRMYLSKDANRPWFER